MRILQKALTFDDVLLVPAHSRILPRDVSLSTRLTRGISLNLPPPRLLRTKLLNSWRSFTFASRASTVAWARSTSM